MGPTIRKAKVRWFDRSSGEGMISIPNECGAFIVACDIPGKKTWYPHTACVFYEDNQEIEVYWDAGIDMWRCLTRGHFDAAKWNSLDQSRLAFKCDDNGKPINGLFG